MSRIVSLLQIAEKLEAAFREKRSPRLTPETAFIAGAALRAWCQHPSRDEIALALCTTKGGCPSLCMTCTGKANMVERLFRGTAAPMGEAGRRRSAE